MCHGFRLKKQDDYFWVDFDHFSKEHHFFRQLGKYWKSAHAYEIWTATKLSLPKSVKLTVLVYSTFMLYDLLCMPKKKRKSTYTKAAQKCWWNWPSVSRVTILGKHGIDCPSVKRLLCQQTKTIWYSLKRTFNSEVEGFSLRKISVSR